jgi:hypothetical protein
MFTLGQVTAEKKDKDRKKRPLPVRQRQEIQKVLHAGKRCYHLEGASLPAVVGEILSTEPGKRIHMQEVFTGQEISVEERSGSSHVRPNDLVFGRAVVVDDVGMIIGLSTHVIPPRYKPGLLDLRKQMGKNRPLTGESLRRWETEIRRIYLEIDRLLFSPPQLCNTDGDPLEFHKLVYDIDSAEDAFVQLASLCVTETAEDLLQSAEKGPDGRIVLAEICWNRQGHKMSTAMTNTLLGNILIEPRRMVKTKEGREAVEALLADAERGAGDAVTDAANLEGIRHVREILGLTKSPITDD